MTSKHAGRSARTKPNPHVGSRFDEFLDDEGLLAECELQAVKELLAMDIKAAMDAEGLSKSAMARRMSTSRPALERLLDPKNTSVTLHTLQRAAAALGKRLHLHLSNA
ncbi:MAG: Fis family transcriptional regulator [Candidatus Hydrogenedens sp.]|nr:Fis family transcriptional regulator [Candidatus Hydrogenedens sp.]